MENKKEGLATANKILLFLPLGLLAFGLLMLPFQSKHSEPSGIVVPNASSEVKPKDTHETFLPPALTAYQEPAPEPVVAPPAPWKPTVGEAAQAADGCFGAYKTIDLLEFGHSIKIGDNIGALRMEHDSQIVELPAGTAVHVLFIDPSDSMTQVRITDITHPHYSDAVWVLGNSLNGPHAKN